MRIVHYHTKPNHIRIVLPLTIYRDVHLRIYLFLHLIPLLML